MTNSTFPNEWLQPLVAEKVAELNHEAMKDFVTIEKKVYDVLQKNNLDLMDRLDKARECLRFYAFADIHKYHQDGGELSRKCLKEIEK